MGEKGIETFFYHHCCNDFCHSNYGTNGRNWSQPRQPQEWFESNEGTSMISSVDSYKLKISNAQVFRLNYQNEMVTYNEVSDEDSDSDSDSYY